MIALGTNENPEKPDFTVSGTTTGPGVELAMNVATLMRIVQTLYPYLAEVNLGSGGNEVDPEARKSSLETLHLTLATANMLLVNRQNWEPRAVPAKHEQLREKILVLEEEIARTRLEMVKHAARPSVRAGAKIDGISTMTGDKVMAYIGSKAAPIFVAIAGSLEEALADLDSQLSGNPQGEQTNGLPNG
jgi:hypothetical protein